MFIKIIKYRFIILSIALIGIMFSCMKVEEYPPEPIINLDNFGVMKTVDNQYDSIGRFQLSFTDGDGDLGIDDDDVTEDPFNLFIKVSYIEDNIIIEEENGLDSRIPHLPTSDNQKYLKGTITDDISFDFFPSERDSLIFEIYVVDRSLNESNRVSANIFGINIRPAE